MSEQLPAPDFDSKNYERPNLNWFCGHAADGQPCRAGPDGSGRCQARSECAPVLEVKAGETKGRWRCTRPGGACETGPRPDGACGRPIAKCSPVPALRAQRGRFTVAVVTATVAFLLIMLGNPPLRTGFINPGGLSTPHSSEAFLKLHSGTNRADQTCSACHKAGAFGPSKLAVAAFQASPGPFEFVKFFKTGSAEMAAIDESCQKCHSGHASHQPNVTRELSCSFCHKEHRGSGPIPVPTEDRCAFCHSDPATMAAAAAKGESLPPDAFRSRVKPGQNAFPTARPAKGFTEIINHFASDHPEFRVRAEQSRDPDTLKFGHALHLTSQTIPGLPNGEKLTCAFCHQPDSAGIYYRPVKFEAHCRSCHSLQFDPETPGLTLPHGNPNSVAAFLHSLPKQYADYAQLSGITGAEEQSAFVQEKLRKLQALAFSGENLEKRAFFSTSVAGPLARAGTVNGPTRALYPGCVYCHEVRPNSPVPEISKPIMFERWLTRGSFNHAKHSKVACSECHAAEKSKVTADIILPAKETCAACHSHSGGVADSCATCHSYHAKGNLGSM